ncbi:MAG TPA: hypothetical protein VKC34_16345, partial [Blastocatellia bacterium]|nr:hypothetical protein [Blastocatellia bacterium]
MIDNQETSLASPSAVGADRQPQLPGHLFRLPGGEWKVWRWVGLRGAGFPFKEVLRFSASECGKLADRLIEAEDEAVLAWEAAQEALRHELDGASGEKRVVLVRAMKDLKKGKVPKDPEPLAFAGPAMRKFAAAFDRTGRAWTDYYGSFPESVEKISREICEVARMEQFREAVIWQNRGAYHTGVKALSRGSLEAKTRGSKHRQHEELVANYWQRYCAKNDT